MFHRFLNRYDAAMELLPLLEKYRKADGIVLAVPRGGVPIAYYIAKKYNMPLELLMTKKIGYPGHPEFAIGSVSLEDHIIDEAYGAPKEYIEKEVETIRASLRERYNKFMGNHKPADLNNKIVIIVDDGIATGHTILAAIKMIRKRNPQKIVVAVPVAPPETAARIKKEVDELICLYTPQMFIGVGLHYADFVQVSDEEVIRLLKEVNHIGNAA